MAEPRLVFRHTIEGLFLNRLGSRLTPRLKERLREEAHLNLDQLLPGYPVEDWYRAIELTAQELYPALPAPEAYAELGRQLIAGYFETFIGKALAGMVRVLGPERTLRRLERSMRGANNYTATSLTQLTPTHFVVTVNESSPTRHLMRGILEGGLSAAGAKELKVEITSVESDTSAFDVTWSA